MAGAAVRPCNPEVGLVLAGGGARGAYEAGALSVLLPKLDGRGERPGVLLGTSIGAVNTALLASQAHLAVEESVRTMRERWLTVQWRDILGPLLSPAELGRVISYMAELLNIPGFAVRSLLDTSPQNRFIEELIDFRQLAENVAIGKLPAAAVAATSYALGDSVVFFDTRRDKPSPKEDQRRGIRYAPTELRAEHVLASAAIEAAFPAVRVSGPPGYAGWYGDGGTRLNTPIKPALKMGAKKVIVIGLNSLRPPPTAIDERPDMFDGIAQVAQALLADPLAHDVQTLSTINRAINEHSSRSEDSADAETSAGPEVHYRRIPYIFIAPADRLAIGRVAVKVWQTESSKLANRLCERDVGLLGSILDAGRNPVRGELLSYLFFAPAFHRALIDLGAADAQRWLNAHDPEPWTYEPPMPTLSPPRAP